MCGFDAVDAVDVVDAVDTIDATDTFCWSQIIYNVCTSPFEGGDAVFLLAKVKVLRACCKTTQITCLSQRTLRTDYYISGHRR